MDNTTLSNQPTDEIARLALAAREALTDNMVERLAGLGGNALELIDRLNDEHTSAAIHSLIDRLTELHRSGALETLCDMVMTIHAARNALTDSMVERLFAFFEYMIDTVGNEAMGELAENTRIAFEEAVEESARPEARAGGLIAMLSLLSKPETQRSLAFLLTLGEKLRRRTGGVS